MNLRSPGGNVGEALKIGTLLRSYLVTVFAPGRDGNQFSDFNIIIDEKGVRSSNCEGPTCICASSCAFIWLGAVERYGVVGIHRPKFTDPEFAALPPDQAASVYKSTLAAVSGYLEEMEAPRSVIDRMQETSTADIFWIPTDGHKLKDPPSYREWVDASCGSFSDAEDEEHWKFRPQESEEQRAKREELSRKEF